MENQAFARDICQVAFIVRFIFINVCFIVIIIIIIIIIIDIKDTSRVYFAISASILFK